MRRLQNRRRLLSIPAVTFCAVVLGVILVGGAAAKPQSGRLVIAGYGGLTAPLLQKYIYDPFTKDTGIQVQALVVPGQQVAGISAQNAAKSVQWDMTVGLADTDMATLLSKGYLASMPKSLQATIKKYVPDVRPWGVPVQRGAVMIGCNYKLVKKCPKSPKDFFDTKDFPGARTLPSFQPLVAIAFALEAAGVKPADIFPASVKKSTANIKRAISMLNAIKPSIKTFYSSSSTAIQLVNSGEVTMGGFWNGTLASYLANHPTSNVSFGATWNGAATYSQWDVVFKGGPDVANAWTFIDWLFKHPTNVAQYSTLAVTATTDPRAFAQMPAKTRQWLPSTAKTRPPSINTNPVWYIRNPAQQKMIDDFWTSFTNS